MKLTNMEDPPPQQPLKFGTFLSGNYIDNKSNNSPIVFKAFLLRILTRISLVLTFIDIMKLSPECTHI